MIYGLKLAATRTEQRRTTNREETSLHQLVLLFKQHTVSRGQYKTAYCELQTAFEKQLKIGSVQHHFMPQRQHQPTENSRPSNLQFCGVIFINFAFVETSTAQEN